MSAHRQSIAAALLNLRSWDEEAEPVGYSSAVADLLIALTAPLVEESKKQTALLEILVKQGDRAALRKQPPQYDTSGLLG